MDTLLNEGINSNSVLENAKSAQKYYNDVYSTLDVSLLHPARDLTVGVEVQIGDKDYDETQSKTSVVSGIASNINIANVAQARVAPDLSDLRQGQEFNNHLQAAGSGIAEIRDNLDLLATQIQPDENYAENEVVQEAVTRIREIVESSTYAGKPVFVSLEDNTALSAIDIADVGELTEKKYAEIQGTIIANAERVALDNNNVAMTKGSETFILTQSNSNKVFSFPESTPLDEINNVIADFSEDSSIHPLIYFDASGTGEPEVVTGEGQGPVKFAGSLSIASLDGELFSVPLQSYAQESATGYSTRDGRVVETDSSSMSMEDDLGENRVAGTINLAEDNVVAGVDIDNMRSSNHTLSRSERFNQRLAEDRKAGDGFAVTPLNPGESSGVLTAGGTAESDSTQSDYDARIADEIQDVPDEIQDENFADDAENSLSPAFAAAVTASDDTGLRTVFGTADSSNEEQTTVMERIVPRRGDENAEDFLTISDDELASGVITEPAAVQDNNNNESLTADLSAGTNTLSYEIQVKSSTANSSENDNTGVQDIAAAGTDGTDSRGATSTQIQASAVSAQKQSTTEDSAVSTADSTTNTADTATTEAETAAVETENSEIESNAEDEIDYGKARFIGTNPVKELENIEGTVAETLLFTLRGNRGELDYVVSAGVSVDVLSLAINTTTNFTGVTANTANGRISLVGASSLLESLRLSAISAASAYAASSNNENGNSASDFADSSEQDVLDLLISTEEDTETESDAGEVTNKSLFSSRVNMADLGFTQSENGTFTLEDFAAASTPEELSSEPQLARQVIANSYRYIDTVQNNLDSINSLNIRNTYDALQRVSTNILDNSVEDVQTASDAETVLNNIAVGINNIVSINGGRGLSDNTVVSFNLLSNIDFGSTVNQPGAEVTVTGSENNMFGTLADYQYTATVNETTGGQNANSDYAALNAYAYSVAAVQSDNMQVRGIEEEDSLVRFDDMLAQAQESITEIQRINEEGLQRREDSRENIRRAEERYFTAIENAKDTIREYGRKYESEDYERNTVREEASERVGAVQERINSVSETDYTALSETLQNLGNVETAVVENQAVSDTGNVYSSSAADINTEPVNVAWDADSMSKDVTADNSLIETAPVMDSLTTREPVAVTASTAGGSSPVMADEKQAPENVIKLFEDKIGTVMVHDQGYTIKDLEGSMAEMLETEPVTTASILDTALQDIENIRQEVADLQAQELEDTGEYLLAALETYGSDQNAANPLVISAMARA